MVDNKADNREFVEVRWPGMDGVKMQAILTYLDTTDRVSFQATSIDIDGDAPILRGDGTILDQMRHRYRVPVRIAAPPEPKGNPEADESLTQIVIGVVSEGS